MTEQLDDFMKEKRDYRGQDDFVAFIAWRQMKALETIAKSMIASAFFPPQQFYGDFANRFYGVQSGNIKSESS
jgi:hypothetical protein